jgi:hypothetical protein
VGMHKAKIWEGDAPHMLKWGSAGWSEGGGYQALQPCWGRPAPGRLCASNPDAGPTARTWRPERQPILNFLLLSAEHTTAATGWASCLTLRASRGSELPRLSGAAEQCKQVTCRPICSSKTRATACHT